MKPSAGLARSARLAALRCEALSKPTQRDELVCALEDKLKDFQAENSLLGRLLNDLQAERNEFQAKLDAAQQEAQQAKQSAAADRQQGQALEQKLASTSQELQRLRGCAKAQTGVTDKWRACQRELEDALLECKDECIRQGKDLAAVRKANTELQEKLKAAGKRAAEAIKVQQQVESKARLAADKAAQQARALQADNAALQAQVQSSGAALQHAQAQLAEAEQKCTREMQDLKQRHAALQAAHADASLQHSTAACSLQHQLAHWRRRAEAGEHERDVAVAGLTTVQGSEDSMHTNTHVALGQAERVRRELAECAERCEELHATTLQLTTDKSQLAAELARHESMLNEAHAHNDRLQGQLLEAEMRGLSELRELAVAGAQQEGESTSGSTDRLQEQVKVLQYSIQQLEAKQRALADQVAAAGAERDAATHELTRSRDAELATLRALQAELRRVQALERLRLTDISELHDLQRRLQLAHEAGWHLRKTVAQERMGRRCPFGDMHSGCLDMHEAGAARECLTG